MKNGRTKPHVLFVTERWPDGNPELGETNSEHNLFGTLRASGLATYDRFHYDEYFRKYERPGDVALKAICATLQPDLVVLSWLNGTPYNPSLAALEAIRTRHATPIVAIWWDTVDDRVMANAEQVRPLADLSIVVDSSTAYLRAAPRADAYLPLWAPQDPGVYFDGGLPRDVDVSFTGTLYPERQAGVLALRGSGIEVLQVGGQRTKRVSLEEYARVHMRSKIALNFPRTFDTYQAKGRIYEVTLCGAMLMEMDNPETARWFEPMVEYVPFVGREDLVEKARYYLAHDDERAAIAERGKQKALDRYSAAHWWRTIFDRVLGADWEAGGEERTA